MSTGRSSLLRLALFAVVLAHVATGERYQTLSRSRGDYNFFNFVPGTHRMGNQRVDVQGTTSVDANTGKNIFAADNYQISAGIAVQSAMNYGFAWRSK